MGCAAKSVHDQDCQSESQAGSDAISRTRENQILLLEKMDFVFTLPLMQAKRSDHIQGNPGFCTVQLNTGCNLFLAYISSSSKSIPAHLCPWFDALNVLIECPVSDAWR